MEMVLLDSAAFCLRIQKHFSAGSGSTLIGRVRHGEAQPGDTVLITDAGGGVLGQSTLRQTDILERRQDSEEGAFQPGRILTMLIDRADRDALHQGEYLVVLESGSAQTHGHEEDAVDAAQENLALVEITEADAAFLRQLRAEDLPWAAVFGRGRNCRYFPDWVEALRASFEPDAYAAYVLLLTELWDEEGHLCRSAPFAAFLLCTLLWEMAPAADHLPTERESVASQRMMDLLVRMVDTGFAYFEENPDTPVPPYDSLADFWQMATLPENDYLPPEVREQLANLVDGVHYYTCLIVRYFIEVSVWPYLEVQTAYTCPLPPPFAYIEEHPETAAFNYNPARPAELLAGDILDLFARWGG